MSEHKSIACLRRAIQKVKNALKSFRCIIYIKKRWNFGWWDQYFNQSNAMHLIKRSVLSSEIPLFSIIFIFYLEVFGDFDVKDIILFIFCFSIWELQCMFWIISTYFLSVTFVHRWQQWNVVLEIKMIQRKI